MKLLVGRSYLLLVVTIELFVFLIIFHFRFGFTYQDYTDEKISFKRIKFAGPVVVN